MAAALPQKPVVEARARWAAASPTRRAGTRNCPRLAEALAEPSTLRHGLIAD